MKVLMISGDKHLLTPGNEAYTRLELQRAQVEELSVCVWPQVHTLWQVWRVARSQRYDIITAQDPFWRGLVAWLLARLTHTKLQLQVHTDILLETKHRPHRRMLARFLLKRADRGAGGVRASA